MDTIEKQPGSVTRLLNQFTLDPIRDARLDLSGLSRGDRNLIILGYIICTILFVLTLLLESLGSNLSAVQYQATNATREVSIVVALITALVYPLAWAFILLGGARASRRVFYPLLMIYTAILLITIYTMGSFFDCGLLPFSLIFLAAFQWLGKRQGWLERHPIVSFLFLVVIVLFQTNIGSDAIELPQILKQFDVFLRFLNFLAWPIWILGGLALITFCTSLVSEVMRALPRSFSTAGFLRFSMITLITQLLLSIAFAVILSGIIQTSPFTGPVISGVLILAMVVLMGAKKWNVRTAAVLLATHLLILLLLVGLTFLFFSGTNISDPLGIINERIRLFPTGAFFMFNLALSILGFFVPFANSESPSFPRPARMNVTLGFALLFTSMMFFFLFARDINTGENYATSDIFNNLFIIGAVFAGLPYALFIIFRRQEALIGPHAIWEQLNMPPARLAHTNIAVWIIVLVPVWLFILRILRWIFTE